ncbi:hypothetical protein NMY22_g19716 [Coprinellus aureogranulatus]|nr:hypothetical protein NMY22_g19716 [Coprinellus aureogranulatus]
MPDLVFTPLEDITKASVVQKYETLRNGFQSGKLKSTAYRKYQLLQLAHMVKENSVRITEALKQDLGRPVLESQFLDIDPSISEVMKSYNNVEKWSKSESAPFNIQWFAMKPTIHKEAKGTVLIISPFNYPFYLSIAPIGSAIAAGCTVLLKPSENSPASSALTEELIAKYLDPDVVTVVNGAIPETTRVLELRWDHNDRITVTSQIESNACGAARTGDFAIGLHFSE